MIFKFPTTPHLTILGDIQIRDDKVMTESERNEFIQHEIIVEEKVDGANLGISFDIEEMFVFRIEAHIYSFKAVGSGRNSKIGLRPEQRPFLSN